MSIVTSIDAGLESKLSRVTRNPNDEITVTYLFYELQRRYKLREYLFDVEPVVYVAMDVPPAHKIDNAWIRNHDWIISGALLDESFREGIEIVLDTLPHPLKATWSWIFPRSKCMAVLCIPAMTVGFD